MGMGLGGGADFATAAVGGMGAGAVGGMGAGAGGTVGAAGEDGVGGRLRRPCLARKRSLADELPVGALETFLESCTRDTELGTAGASGIG
jgi:hypothetical protein